MELLSKSIPATLLIFVVSSMLAAGLSLSVHEIFAAIRNGRLVFVALLANFVLMPMGAVGIARLLRLDQPLGIALVLFGAAAGSPFLPKLVAIARGDPAIGVGLMVLLMVVTVIYMPLVLPLVLKSVSVHPATIAGSLVLFMLLPLGTGLGLKARFRRVTERARPLLNQISNLSLAFLFILLLATNLQNVVGLFGTRGILASILFILLGFALGWLLGGPALGTKGSLALGTAQRGIGAALLAGRAGLDDSKVMVMLAVIAIVGLVILLPSAHALASQDGRSSKSRR